MNALRHFLLAVQFFTRLPITGALANWVGFSPAMLRASAAHFPGVGWVVAAASCGVAALALWALPDTPFRPLVAAVLATVVSVWLTGGFHEDGLADLIDGLGGSLNRERALEIMKDSRIGAFGAMALVLALLTKVALLALLGSLSAPVMLAALAAGHVVSRGLPLLLIWRMPHVGDSASSKSKPLADAISGQALLAAALWVLPALVLMAWALGGWPTVGGLLAAVAALAYMARWLWQRLQGFTGDGLGATQQVCEIALYLGVAVCWSRP
jgi:adenosylcobinamide-GDP ribazoletransferase